MCFNGERNQCKLVDSLCAPVFELHYSEVKMLNIRSLHDWLHCGLLWTFYCCYYLSCEQRVVLLTCCSAPDTPLNCSASLSVFYVSNHKCLDQLTKREKQRSLNEMQVLRVDCWIHTEITITCLYVKSECGSYLDFWLRISVCIFDLDGRTLITRQEILNY